MKFTTVTMGPFMPYTSVLKPKTPSGEDWVMEGVCPEIFFEMQV